MGIDETCPGLFPYMRLYQDLREFMLHVHARHKYTFATNNNIAIPNFLQSILNKSNLINDIVRYVQRCFYLKFGTVCSCINVQECQSNILQIPIKYDPKKIK